MRRASDKQILELPPTIREFLVLILSKGTDLLSYLIYFGHWEKLVVKLTQQALPRGNRARCVGIQPLYGSIMEEKGKSLRWTDSLEKFWNLVVA
jgi:hypothetical protein